MTSPSCTGGQVARLVVEPGPDGGVEPDVGGSDQRLALGGLGRRRGDQLGVTGLDQPGRAAAQQDLAVRQFGHGAETTHWTRSSGSICAWNPQDDPEKRIRDLERPLADAARASELGDRIRPAVTAYPPPRRARRRRRRATAHRHGRRRPVDLRRPVSGAAAETSSGNRMWWILGTIIVIGAAGSCGRHRRLCRTPTFRCPVDHQLRRRAPRRPDSAADHHA